VTKPCVFIHTNHKQYLGALVSMHSMRRNSRHANEFEVKLIEYESYQDFFAKYEGRTYSRDGDSRTWDKEDLQSFTPLRFLPPELMNYDGRAIVVDPDVFAVQDVWELLSRDMEGEAIMCRQRGTPPHYASSVMLLDCAKLKHWRLEKDFDALFVGQREYKKWMNLGYEAPATIGLIEPEWNDFDKLTPRTKMIHNTRRKTQPWKSGLPVDFIPAESNLLNPVMLLNRIRRKLFGEYAFLGSYKDHPDERQTQLFFGYLKECLAIGLVSEELVKEHMAANHVRHDAFEVIGRTPPLEDVLPKAA
jgi:hypothetical protein